jgi:hypothetical protein
MRAEIVANRPRQPVDATTTIGWHVDQLVFACRTGRYGADVLARIDALPPAAAAKLRDVRAAWEVVTGHLPAALCAW